jgi:lipopolysaccharide export system protein LptC
MSSRIEASRPLASALLRARIAPILSFLAALSILVLIGGFAWQGGLSDVFWPSPPPATSPVGSPDEVTVGNATISGLDREGQPYSVSARAARQDAAAAHLVHLEEIAGTFRRTTGEVLTLASERGLYDTKKKTLALEGAVKLVSEGRFTALMDKALVEVDSKRLTSNSAVSVDLASGRIRAGGVEITDDGRNILFLNRVATKFAPASTGDGKP